MLAGSLIDDGLAALQRVVDAIVRCDLLLRVAGIVRRVADRPEQPQAIVRRLWWRPRGLARLQRRRA